MITDEIMDALDMMIELCTDKQQKLGIVAVKEMLGDFDEQAWLNMDNPSECKEWLSEYLGCESTKVIQHCLNCSLYDKNDPIHAYGTCEPQDKDFHCTHECNLSDNEKASIIKFLKSNGKI